MNTTQLLRLAPIALLLAVSASQARTHVAPHVFEAKGSRCAQGQHIAQAQLRAGMAVSSSSSSSACDADAAPPADVQRVREAPSRPGIESRKKEYTGHVTLMK